MKKIISLLVPVIAFLLSFYAANGKVYETKEWKDVVGTIEAMGNDACIHYKVDGEWYTGRYDLHISGQTTGEKFTMRYNIKNPKEIQIDYWNPLFEKGEKTEISEARIKRVNWCNFFEPKYAVQYTFKVRGFKIKKSQALPPGYKNKYPYLKTGQVYEVEFLSENPLRSVVHLDKIKGTR